VSKEVVGLQEEQVSKEVHSIKVGFTTQCYENAPAQADGTPTYADDTYEMLKIVIRDAVFQWYKAVGHHYLACEPDVI